MRAPRARERRFRRGGVELRPVCNLPRRRRMAKSGLDNDLFKRLRDSGLRKNVARAIAEAGDNSSKLVRGTVDELRGLADELDSRVRGGQSSKSRSAAAKKGAATRKRASAQRSASARKGAATRAAKSGSSRSSSSKSSSSRSKSSSSRSGGSQRVELVTLGRELTVEQLALVEVAPRLYCWSRGRHGRRRGHQPGTARRYSSYSAPNVRASVGS